MNLEEKKKKPNMENKKDQQSCQFFSCPNGAFNLLTLADAILGWSAIIKASLFVTKGENILTADNLIMTFEDKGHSR